MGQPRRSWSPGVFGGSVVLVVGTVLAACGGGGTSVSSKATTTTTSIPASSTTTGGANGSTSCPTAQFSASFSRVDAGAGNRYVQVILTNNGPSSCSTIGYVGMQLLGVGGQALPTNVVRGGTGTPTPVPTTVMLAPGAQASATLHWGAIPSGNEPQNGACEATPEQVQITPPNATQPLTVGWSFGPVCGQGRIDAGPLQAGVPSF